MSQAGGPILSTLIVLPLLGVLLLTIVDGAREGLIKRLALAVSGLDLLLSLIVYVRFDPAQAGMQFVERASWIPSIGSSYFLGVDGISLPLLLLTTFLTPIAILASFSGIASRVKAYMICMLLLLSGMIGVFVALDLVLFYVFWEGMLIPMYFLIGVWGGPRRIYATLKFVLFTMAGSVLMLLAMIALAFLHQESTGQLTFDLLELIGGSISYGTQLWLFAAFGLAFAIKVPMFPFHTWLPDAHVEAPTAGSVLLAGVLLKMGTYGFLRFALPLFPEAAVAFTPLISALAVIGILYGALVAMVQDDLKRLIAYSSVSHLGFVMLGIFAMNVQAVEGSILQMVNHGLSTGALFLLIGMIYERRHTRMIEEFGGLSRTLPRFALCFLVVTMSSIGLPGLNGFVGEFLILTGTFRVHKGFAVIATLGVILAAVYMLWMWQRVMWGKSRRAENLTLNDIGCREMAILVPIILLILWIGLNPNPLLRRMDASVIHLLDGMRIAATSEVQIPPSPPFVKGGWGDLVRSAN
ncbi:NADH-quinone oxidoreductase subunit M [Candidatus Methylomirabilis limnetica]|uniref:NADH-quinone oxidoreductase subunit M n=1 Tax=Candidatus Methylomirabilis limnetica TaxID=2033718 RepID=A0A2T4U0V6_9BACT|nr:NADH-quinone oxidoreductase subunit M [Candidatus Methylomirabilis limnetica]PTL37003.1 NADH-quinone oxidoreductase subunit M [Candidatus Methylomirabilis limnetica]